MMAAISAASAGLDGIMILEHNDRVGKKLLSTGNGRCNITNIDPDPEYYGSSLFINEVLSGFSVDDTMNFFEDLGLMLSVEDQGRVYPRCSQASAVLDILRFACDRYGIDIVCSVKIQSIDKRDGYYSIRFNGIGVETRSVIIACGGKAAPFTGSDGSINPLLERMNYSFAPQTPALVPFAADPALTKTLKGVRVKGDVLLVKGKNNVIARESGEIQFNEGSISGVCVMQLSARVAGDDDLCLAIRLFPELSRQQIFDRLKAKREQMAKAGIADYLIGFVNKKLGIQIIKRSLNEKLNRHCGDLDDNELGKIADMLFEMRIPVRGLCGFDKAQVTSGGLLTAQFDRRTLMSIKDNGLFACGEILDVHGLCGGYNLQWAWSSGYVAGSSAARFVLHNGRGFNQRMAKWGSER